MMVQDEYGNWYDDGSGDEGQFGYDYQDPGLYGANMFLPQMPGTNYSTSKWNFGQQLPVGQNVYNQILTGMKNQNALLTNPSVAYNAFVATGQPTMDVNALLGLDQSGNPYLGSGGGGGGGGSYNANFTTPYLSSLQSGDETDQAIFNQVMAGASPRAIKANMRADNPALFEMDANGNSAGASIDDAIDQAFQEKSAYDRNELVGANQPAQQTPIQEWLAKNGMINPTEQYTADNLPADVDVSWAADYARQAGNQALTDATNTGAHIKQLNDERRGLQMRAMLNNAIVGLQRGAMEDAVRNPKDLNKGSTVSYDANGKPIYADVRDTSDIRTDKQLGRNTHTIYDPGRTMDTGQARGPLGGVSRFVNDAVARRFNPGGDVDRMAILKRTAAAQERRKADLVRSAQAAPAYDEAIRRLAAARLQQSGRTPARDAQRVMLNYMRQQGGI